MKKVLIAICFLLLFCGRKPTSEKVQLLLLNTLKGAGRANSIAFSPDGHFLAFGGGRDMNVKVWNTSNWTQVKSLPGHTDFIGMVSFHPDGRYLVSAGYDGTVRVWQTSDWSEVKILTGHRNAIFAVAFSPNGKYLATGGNDNTVRIWRCENWTEIKTLTGHKAKVVSVVFSPNGECLASGSYDKTVKIWKTEDFTEIKTLPFKDVVRSITFSPDGKHLACGGVTKMLYVWDTGNWEQISQLRFRPVSFIGFHPKEMYLLASNWLCSAFRIPFIDEYQLRMWDTQNWSLLLKSKLKDEASVIAFSPDGQSIAFGQGENIVIYELRWIK